MKTIWALVLPVEQASWICTDSKHQNWHAVSHRTVTSFNNAPTNICVLVVKGLAQDYYRGHGIHTITLGTGFRIASLQLNSIPRNKEYFTER